MKVLVTGATAPLGRAVVDGLLTRDDVAEVIAVGLEPGAKGMTTGPRLRHVQVDLTRERGVHDLLFGVGRAVDVVIHGALHRSATDSGDRVHRANVESTRLLLRHGDRHPALRQLVFLSTAEVYALRATEPSLIDEDHPLELDPAAPQWVRDRVEADLLACAHVGRSRFAVTVLRFAEVLAPDCGSQLWDYVRTRVCLRPAGFDPMINVLSVADHVAAIELALGDRDRGIFNIPGADTLPLSEVIARSGRLDIPVPGPLLSPLYRLRTRVLGLQFRYDQNLRRFHFGGVLDGTRARVELGYQPTHPLRWPHERARAA